MENFKIKNTIDALARVVTIEESKRQELIDRYSNMPDSYVIKELSSLAYRVIERKSELFDYALTIIRNINVSICPDIETMKSTLDKMFSNEIEGNMSLEENHKLINKELKLFCNLFNQNEIDYYIVGALPCFIKTNQPLFRYHDDIDIMINEEDIPKLEEIMKVTGYQFYDDRFPSKERYIEMENNKPPHTVLAQNMENEFHLGFFCFRRENDNSITMREYSHRIENDSVVTDVLERQSDPFGTSLRYDEKPTQYMGTYFRTSSVENVYNLKNYTKRPKDITDMEKLAPYINQEKLNALYQHPNQNVKLSNVQSEINVSKK